MALGLKIWNDAAIWLRKSLMIRLAVWIKYKSGQMDTGRRLVPCLCTALSSYNWMITYW